MHTYRFAFELHIDILFTIWFGKCSQFNATQCKCKILYPFCFHQLEIRSNWNIYISHWNVKINLVNKWSYSTCIDKIMLKWGFAIHLACARRLNLFSLSIQFEEKKKQYNNCFNIIQFDYGRESAYFIKYLHLYAWIVPGWKQKFMWRTLNKFLWEKTTAKYRIETICVCNNTHIFHAFYLLFWNRIENIRLNRIDRMKA